jgi:DNA-binding NtrC family response regulator
MAHILVVDDDEDVLDSLEDTLRDAGHTVVAVRSADQALASQPHTFDVLLIDLWMRPGSSGLELKRELDERKVLVPVVVMSSDDDVGTYAARGGCVEYLHKPFSPDQLHAALSRALADGPDISSDHAPLVSMDDLTPAARPRNGDEPE